MKSFCKCGALLTFAWLSSAGAVWAQSSPYGSQSLLTMPSTRPQATAPYGYRVASAAPLLSSDYGPSLASQSQVVPPVPPSLPEPSPSDVPRNTLPSPYGTLDNSTSSIINGASTPSCDGNSCCMGGVPCCGGGGGAWFGSVGGIALTRNNPNAFWTTYRTNQNELQLMNTKEATGNWGGGGQVTFGRWWCGCGNGCGGGGGIGLQFVYWQVFGMGGYSNYKDPNNNLSTPIDLGGVNITSGAGTFPAGNFFDNSPEHQLWRNDQILNLELNVLHQTLYSAPNRCSVTCLAGVRYFRFQDTLTFGSVAFGHQFGDNGGADEAYLRSQCTNNLWGAQIGFLGNYAFTPRFGVYALPKIGAFGNSINIRNQLYTGDGFSQFDIHAHQNQFSLLGEVDLGTYWWISPRCQLFAGWRVIGVSQVALADNQFLPYLADTAGYGTVKANGDLILTGGFAGLAFTF